MLYQIIEDGQIIQSYAMLTHPEIHNDSKHLVTAGVRQEISTKTSSSSILPSEHTVLIDASAGARTMILPTVGDSTHRIYVFKKIDSSANNAIIDGAGADTIDGAETKILTSQYESCIIQSDGTEWHVIG